ncbi:septation protein SepH [Nocardioides daejeonensis]|uniref:septation protein SepH n=1 Tax=Nocardioides daejeonensis TaxID=1046556 RepID=UPI000D74FAE7|nr:septation protein SepH [Nocardioides daejeonensis]
MLHLTLAGLSEDKQRLLLVSDSGARFSLDVDAKLRAAVRGDRSHIGQLEIQMESILRPRDIQARIRAGETPEAVAQAAQTTTDRIAPFVNPVLAERAHMAERAQRSSVRRRTGDTGARTLGDAVAAQLRVHGVGADSVEWDAWRRDDGRWTLTATYEAADQIGIGHFSYDVPGNYVLVDDDDARWLVGDAAPVQPAEPAPRNDLEEARIRRQAQEREEPTTLGDDALALITSPDPAPAAEAEETTVDLTETARAARDAGRADDPALAPTPEPMAEAEHADGPRTPPAEQDAAAAEEAPAPRRASRRKGRASVPSWDEIMFGGSSE